MVAVTQTPTPFRWQPNLGMLLFAAVFLPLTLALGVWQLGRADEKRAMLTEYQSRGHAAPVPLESLDAESDQQYRRVLVTGRFVADRTLLLQNRIRDGKPGYEVLAPFETAPGAPWLWVNRGWLEGSYDRAILPQVPAVEGTPTLHGHLYRSDDAFTLGEEVWRETWPQVFQNADMTLLSERLQVTFFPYVLRLDQDSPAALRTGWEVVNIRPETHTGYAVQWFALAAVLVLLSLFNNSNLGAVIKERRGKNRSQS